MNISPGSPVDCASYALISSEDRKSGDTVVDFSVDTSTFQTNIQYLIPVAFSGEIYLENANARNNSFRVNGILITIPPNGYNPADFMSTLQALLIALVDPSFTVTNTASTYMQGLNANRFTISAAIPFTVTNVNIYTSRWTGLFNQPVAGLTFQFNYTSLYPTNYFDVRAVGLSKGLNDSVSGSHSSDVMFRVNVSPIPLSLRDVVTLEQSSTKRIFFPQRVEWPTVRWQLVDEWGLPLIIQPNSMWWLTLTMSYISKQSS